MKSTLVYRKKSRQVILAGLLFAATGAVAASTAMAGCEDQPATRECDQWLENGSECVQQPQACWVALPGDFGGLNQYHTCWMKQKVLSRGCRTFDGCGNLSGTYYERRAGDNDGLSYFTADCRG